MNHYNSHNLVKAAILAATIVVTVACNKEKEVEMASGNTTAFSEIRLPVSQVPFFANLSNYDLVKSNQKNATRSEDGEETVTLEELLDRSKTKTRSDGGYNIVQIAFKQNEEDVYAQIYSASQRTNRAVPTRVKKYLISATSAAGEKFEFVSVLITSAEYAARNPDFDFFEKPAYTGAIFFCTPEGNLIQTNDYTGGRILGTKMLTPEETQANADMSTKRIVLLNPVVTREPFITHWSGEPAICIDYWPKDKPGGGGAGNDGNDPDPSGNGDNAPPGTTQDRNWDNFGIGVLLPNIPPEILQTCQVKLMSNSEDITMTGGGNFEKGTIIHIDYSLSFDVLEANFTHWTGTFRLKNTAVFDYKVTENVESTAYFNVSRPPCSDGVKSNPLKEMRIAPTDSGDYLKGLYKASIRRWENGVPKYHWGLDLAAEEGTPVYAIQSGTIKRVYSNCPKGKDGNDYNRKYGNQIIIECQGYIDPYNDDEILPGENIIYIQYSHLQYGNAIGFNYREGRLFEQGDRVFAGDLIGYTGRTGNAWSVKNPHLHLGVSPTFVELENGYGYIPEHSYVDPADYINGEIDIQYLKEEMNKKQNDPKNYDNPNINLIKVTDCK